MPDRYDMDNPANQAKLEAADALAELAEEAGITLIEMSLAFLLEHPAVTAPIIGPRTMEQLESQLPAAEIRLSPEVLDKIDEIVPPGIDRQPERGRLDPAGDRRSAPAPPEPAGALAGAGTQGLPQTANETASAVDPPTFAILTAQPSSGTLSLSRFES